MKIGIILNPYGEKKPGGLPRIIFGWAEALISQDRENEYVIYLKEKPVTMPTFGGRAKVVVLGAGRFWLNRLRSAEQADVYLFNTPVLPLFWKPKRTVLIALDYPYMYLKSKNIKEKLFRIFIRAYHRYSLKRVDHIIAVSHSTEKDTMRFFDIPQNKISVIYHGFTNIGALPESALLLPGKFFFFAGTMKERKNVLNIVKAFEIFLHNTSPGTQYELLLAGKNEGEYHEYLLNYIKKAGLEKRVKFIGHLNENELSFCYKRAQALIFPSIVEGTGFPILEAMGAGCPVVASNIFGPAELGANGGAILVDPYDPEEIALGLQKVTNNDGFRAEQIKRGLEQAKLFSWSNTGIETLELLTRISREMHVLITCFHPIISRNILSTDIIPILLSSDSEMKITIVVEDHKTEFFKKRFEKERVSVVSIPRVHTKSGLFFKRLSRNMLDTETTRLRVKAKLIREKKQLYYVGSLFLFWLGHFKAVRSFLRFADQKFNGRRHIQKIFEEVKPDMVFSTDAQMEQDVVFIEEAKARNVSVIGKVRSWDNLSQWGFIRSLPDKLIVQSEELKREAILWHDMPEKDIVVTGVPHYDKYIAPVLEKKEDLLKKFGLDPAKPLIFYAPLADFRIPNNDADRYILEILSTLDANIWVRFPPNDEVTIGDFKPTKNMIFDRPGKETGSGRAIDRDMAGEDDEKLRTVLALSDVVVCGPSSIAIDAAVFDKPIIMVNFSKTERTYWDGVIEYDFTHIVKLLSADGVRVVKSKDDLILWIEKYLKDPVLDKEGRERLRSFECYKIDGQASRRTADFLLEEIKGKKLLLQKK